MQIEAYIDIEISDKNGKVEKHTRFKANSFVRSLMDILYPQLYALAYTNGGLDTGNTTRTIGASPLMVVAAGAGTSGYGIVVGTGTGAVAMSDYKLGTQILHGDTASKLNHGAVTFPSAPTTVGSTRSFQVSRAFQNNSGGSITIEEIGIYCLTSGWNFCLDRTLKTAVVANTKTATVTYTISITV